MIEHGVRYFLDRSKGFDVVEVIRVQDRAREIVDDAYKCERKFYSAEPLFRLDAQSSVSTRTGRGAISPFLGST